MDKSARNGRLLIAPLMLGCVLFYLAPFCLVIFYSLTKGMGKSRWFSGLETYRHMLSNSVFQTAFGNTLRFLAVSLPLMMLLSYLLALLMQKQAQKHKLLKSVFLFPYVMPVAGTVLLVDAIFGELGVWNQLYSVLGIPLAQWLKGPSAFWIVVGLYLWKNAGYSVILLLAGLVTISGDQYESADLEGASSLQKFIHITTPQMWTSVFFALVFSMINAFKCFREIFLIGGEHPDRNIYMLQHFINSGFKNLNYGKLSVASILLFIVILLALGLFYCFVNRKEAFRE